MTTVVVQNNLSHSLRQSPFYVYLCLKVDILARTEIHEVYNFYCSTKVPTVGAWVERSLNYFCERSTKASVSHDSKSFQVSLGKLLGAH